MVNRSWNVESIDRVNGHSIVVVYVDNWWTEKDFNGETRETLETIFSGEGLDRSEEEEGRRRERERLTAMSG